MFKKVHHKGQVTNSHVMIFLKKIKEWRGQGSTKPWFLLFCGIYSFYSASTMLLKNKKNTERAKREKIKKQEKNI